MSREVFDTRRIDEDTKILSEQYHEFDGVPVLEERWHWEGVKATSLVFPTARIAELIVDDGRIKTAQELLGPPRRLMDWLQQHVQIVGQATFKRGDDFCFVNYDFSY